MDNGETAFWKQMFLKDTIPGPEFSLCFSRAADAWQERSGTGALTLGRGRTKPAIDANGVCEEC